MLTQFNRVLKVIKKHKVEIAIAVISVAVTLRGVERIIESHKIVVSFTDLPDSIVLAATEGLVLPIDLTKDEVISILDKRA